MSVMQDLFILPASWAEFAEYGEALEVDFSTRDGGTVKLRGRASARPGTKRILVTAAGPCEAAGLTLADVAGVLGRCVTDGRIGSDVLREAVERQWDVSAAPADDEPTEACDELEQCEDCYRHGLELASDGRCSPCHREHLEAEAYERGDRQMELDRDEQREEQGR